MIPKLPQAITSGQINLGEICLAVLAKLKRLSVDPQLEEAQRSYCYQLGNLLQLLLSNKVSTLWKNVKLPADIEQELLAWVVPTPISTLSGNSARALSDMISSFNSQQNLSNLTAPDKIRLAGYIALRYDELLDYAKIPKQLQKIAETVSASELQQKTNGVLTKCWKVYKRDEESGKLLAVLAMVPLMAFRGNAVLSSHQELAKLRSGESVATMNIAVAAQRAFRDVGSLQPMLELLRNPLKSDNWFNQYNTWAKYLAVIEEIAIYRQYDSREDGGSIVDKAMNLMPSKAQRYMHSKFGIGEDPDEAMRQGGQPDYMGTGTGMPPNWNASGDSRGTGPWAAQAGNTQPRGTGPWAAQAGVPQGKPGQRQPHPPGANQTGYNPTAGNPFAQQQGQQPYGARLKQQEIQSRLASIVPRMVNYALGGNTITIQFPNNEDSFGFEALGVAAIDDTEPELIKESMRFEGIVSQIQDTNGCQIELVSDMLDIKFSVPLSILLMYNQTAKMSHKYYSNLKKFNSLNQAAETTEFKSVRESQRRNAASQDAASEGVDTISETTFFTGADKSVRFDRTTVVHTQPAVDPTPSTLTERDILGKGKGREKPGQRVTPRPVTRDDPEDNPYAKRANQVPVEESSDEDEEAVRPRGTVVQLYADEFTDYEPEDSAQEIKV